MGFFLREHHLKLWIIIKECNQWANFCPKWMPKKFKSWKIFPVLRCQPHVVSEQCFIPTQISCAVETVNWIISFSYSIQYTCRFPRRSDVALPINKQDARFLLCCYCEATCSQKEWSMNNLKYPYWLWKCEICTAGTVSVCMWFAL